MAKEPEEKGGNRGWQRRGKRKKGEDSGKWQEGRSDSVKRENNAPQVFNYNEQ